MVEALLLLILAMCGLAVAAIVRLWSLNRSSSTTATTYVFCLWIVSSVVWNTYYLSFPMPGLFDMSIDRALFFLLLGMACFQVFTNRVSLQANHSIELAMFIFSVICFESMALNGFEAAYPTYPKPLFLFLFGYFAPFCAFLLAKYFIKNDNDFRMVLKTLFMLGVYLCITAIFERNGLKNYVFPRFITSEEFPLHLDRARGPFLNAAFDGVGMTFGFIAGVLLLRGAGVGKRIVIVLLLLLFFPGIFYTHTRSVYLIFLYTLLALLFFYRLRTSKWKYIPMILFLCTSFVVANSKQIFSESREGGGIGQMEEVGIRFQLIERSRMLFSHSPLLGVGLGKFASTGTSPEFFQEKQHNHLIGIAVELGLVGLFSFIGILLLVFKRLYDLASNPANDTLDGANVIIMLTLGITVNSMSNTFLEPSYCPFVNIMTFTFAGLIDRMHEAGSVPGHLRAAYHGNRAP